MGHTRTHDRVSQAAKYNAKGFAGDRVCGYIVRSVLRGTRFGLTSLQKLHLYGCKQLTALPDVSMLPKLTVIYPEHLKG